MMYYQAWHGMAKCSNVRIIGGAGSSEAFRGLGGRNILILLLL
jgi:hypothetical protein